MATELVVGEHSYRVQKLNAIQQFHVARRVIPVLKTAIGALVALKNNEGRVADPMDIIIAMSDDLARMSDEDSEYVLKTCLAVVQRKQGSGWMSLMTAGRFQFEDLELPQMMQLVVAVLQDHFASFFAGDPARHSIAGAPLAG